MLARVLTVALFGIQLKFITTALGGKTGNGRTLIGLIAGQAFLVCFYMCSALHRSCCVASVGEKTGRNVIHSSCTSLQSVIPALYFNCSGRAPAPGPFQDTGSLYIHRRTVSCSPSTWGDTNSCSPATRGRHSDTNSCSPATRGRYSDTNSCSPATNSSKSVTRALVDRFPSQLFAAN